MKQHEQVAMLKRLLALRETRRDERMLDEVVRIPVTKYTDQGLLDRELASAFTRFPLVACHASALSEPGSYVTSDWERFPYVVVRGDDGRVRAFYNQCRHRGARLADERAGCVKNFVCPFHGWVYELDGTLRGITRAHDFPGVDTREYGLVELPAAESGGLIWVARDPGASLDIPGFLGTFHDDLVNFDVASLVQYKKTKVVKEANWKLLIKTYLEGYHVPYLHRDTLARAFKRGVIAHDEDGPHIRLSAARTNVGEVTAKPEEEWRILDHASVYYTLFPNTFFILHPDYVSINTFWPLAPDRTIWTHDMLYRDADFAGSAGQSALEKRFAFTNDTVFDQEDFAIAENVQRSLVHGGSDHHVLGLAEGLLAMFQDTIDARLAPPRDAPPRDTTPHDTTTGHPA
ncbi:Phenylpropionate dioxygenase, large terminal subunit [Streptomyces zhaozhouensis]|uniref:Phenylpropionate dioxygenase, large terminal subunit n=1 Tax=Streptomyces zhaozhouensis TaxID=1300267 RepID=A0A286DTZ8_9ACTN|nr:aromatic ring-hydroxylating dioxygenase subunit alpha [Streptomyces zhaozhouensis]SOD62139.1 Phenylpropionate dioxygenase, large terminal subunit [Streptomyces zhaozhouensis]